MDMESRNHTYVNEQRVDTIDLKSGDIIKAGHTVFELTLTESGDEIPGAIPVSSRPEQPGAPATVPSNGGNATGMMPTLAGQAAEQARASSSPSSERAAPPKRSGGIPPAPVPLPSEVVPPPLPTTRQPESTAPLGPRCLACMQPLREPPALDSQGRVPLERRLCTVCRERMQGMQQVIPGYVLLRELGRGGMGVVYLAAREATDLLVAVKTIIPAVDSTNAEVQKFLREAEILQKLDHPYIVRFQEMSSANGRLWFAMDYVRGKDARRLVKECGPLAIPRAVRLVCQLLEALEYAHERGFVHRDIKPANLLVTERDGREVALLADFGLARVYQASQLSGLTMTGAIGGTPLFMAPEQITHYRQAQPSVDQYAAGMTLYNLLTANYAYNSSEQFRKWVQMVLEAEPTPVQRFRPEIPTRLADIIHRALKKEPTQRFSSISAMRRALQPFA